MFIENYISFIVSVSVQFHFDVDDDDKIICFIYALYLYVEEWSLYVVSNAYINFSDMMKNISS